MDDRPRSTQASATSAKSLLDKLLIEAPFPIRGIQVDGGAEFKSVFEAECQARGLELFVLPPKRPDLNGGVERAQSTWRYQFYATYDLPHQIDKLQAFVGAFAHRFIDERKFGIFRRSPRHRHSRTSLQKARWRFGLVRNAKQWQDADEIGGYLGNSGSRRMCMGRRKWVIAGHA
jgi:hypothetical protein